MEIQHGTRIVGHDTQESETEGSTQPSCEQEKQPKRCLQSPGKHMKSNASYQTTVRESFGQKHVSMQNMADAKINEYKRPVFEIMNASIRLGLYNQLCGVINGTNQAQTKKPWAKIVWGQAWSLDDSYWSNIKHTTREIRYIIWFEISANYPKRITICKTIAKIVCLTSLLKYDCYWLKNLTASHVPHVTCIYWKIFSMSSCNVLLHRKSEI